MPHVVPETAEFILKLHRAGWPARHIARRVGVSDMTVRRVVRGVWKPPPVALCEDDDPFREFRLLARRCPGCGGLVYQWPCLTCEMRAKAERKRLSA